MLTRLPRLNMGVKAAYDIAITIESGGVICRD
jgi:hypothetical protein